MTLLPWRMLKICALVVPRRCCLLSPSSTTWTRWTSTTTGRSSTTTSGTTTASRRARSGKPSLWATPWQCPLCSVSTRTQALLSQHLRTAHARSVSLALSASLVDVYLNIFGEEYKSLDDKVLRYKDGLVVTLQGEHGGQWYSFTKNKGGGPIRAIKEARDVDFFEAMLEAIELVRSLDRLHLLREIEQEESDEENNHNDLKPRKYSEMMSKSRLFSESLLIESNLSRIRTAQSIWNASVPIFGTSAELYLTQHRGIRPETLSRLAFRFLRVGSSFTEESKEKDLRVKRVINKTPALVVKVENNEGDITGVQRIFLDPLTSGKPTWSDFGNAQSARKVCHKYTKGLLSRGLGVIQKGSFGEVVFITEGPETGATIADVLPEENECTIMAALSLANVVNGVDVLAAQYPSLVVFAADNDGLANFQRTTDVFDKLKSELNRRNVEVKLVMPTLEGEEKVDWNDVLLKCGPTEVRRQLLYVNDIDL